MPDGKIQDFNGGGCRPERSNLVAVLRPGGLLFLFTYAPEAEGQRSERSGGGSQRIGIKRRTFFEEVEDIRIISCGIQPPLHVGGRKRKPESETSGRTTRARALRQVLEHNRPMNK